MNNKEKQKKKEYDKRRYQEKLKEERKNRRKSDKEYVKKLKKWNKRCYENNRQKRLNQRKRYLDDLKKNNPEKFRKMRLNSYYKNKELWNLRRKTLRLFGDKRIVCSKCKETENLQFHHLKPLRYDNFISLCRRHHLEQHGREELNAK